MTTYRVRIHRRHGLLTSCWLLCWSLCWWTLAACWWLVVGAAWCCWLAARWSVLALMTWSATHSRSTAAHSSLTEAAEKRSVSDLVAQAQAEAREPEELVR